MLATRAFATILFLAVTTIWLPHGAPTLTARDWVAPTAAAPGLEIDGNPALWSRVHAKALDPVYDGRQGETRGDLMGFYFDQEVDRLSLRVNLFRKPGTPNDAPVLDPNTRVFVLLDYQPGGTRNLPEGVQGTAPFDWDRAIELTEGSAPAAARVIDAGGDDRETERVRSVIASPDWGTMEASLWLPGGFAEAVSRGDRTRRSFEAAAASAAANESTPIEFYVFTTDGKAVLDDIRATNVALSNSHNVAFVQHLNQGFTWTDVFRGNRGENAVNDGDVNNPDDGADELLAAHDYYNLPVNWHQGGLLIGAAEWHDPSFNDWLLSGANAGRYEILTSAYGQHIMPFLRDEINGKSVDLENDMINTLYNYTPRVAWVPERVWVESPDNDGNGIQADAGVIDFIGDDFWDNGVWAVILDDYVHCGYNNNGFDDHHIYMYGGGKILPIDNDFVGQMNYDAGAAWNTIITSTSDEIIIYGNDAEIAAEVSQGASNPSALNNYIWVLQQCSNNAGLVGVWKLTDVLLDPGFTTQPLTLQNGTYGLLGEFGGYGGSNNSWYVDWAGYTGPSNLDQHVPKWNYGQQWDFTLNKILGVPDNNLREMAWYILLTNLHETGWHDGPISGWQHHYSNHIRMANAHAEAARWAGGQYVNPTGAYTADFEDDGVDELVLYNDRLLAVFDSIGGKLQWLFCKGADYNYSVASNDNAYWVDTDGDYNETNHIAPLSDVGVGGINRENDFYSFNVISGTGNSLEVEIIHPDVTRTVTLNLGDPYFRVKYRNQGKQVYVKNGWTPDNLDLTWTGKSIERIWDPDGGGYFGFRNTNTNATAAVVVGTVGAQQNLQFDGTLFVADEFNGTGPFEVIVYGGYASPTDTAGHVAELKTLRDGLTDACGPLPYTGTYYDGIDRLTLFFDEAVATGSVNVTGFAIDDDNDGTAEVTLTGSDVLTTTGSSIRLDFDLSPASAAALDALAGPLELLLAAGSVQDGTGNGNPLVTHLDDVAVGAIPATKVLIDGLFDTGEWDGARKVVDDDTFDSAWNSSDPPDTNEIRNIFVDWDDTYLYLGVRGQVGGNSWILYLDTDYNGPNGYNDLSAIDTWERGAIFGAPGFKPDFQLGAYQHQSPFDGQSFWRLTSATTSEDLTGQIVSAFDPDHVNGFEGGSEIAVPWDLLYGLAPGQVPVGAEIAVVASVCWDPEPDGVLGGDVAPNVDSTLPLVDNACSVVVDSDNDGLPDPPAPTSVPGTGVGNGITLRAAFPNPLRGSTRIPVQLPVADGGQAAFRVQAEVFDLAGRRVRRVHDATLPAGEHQIQWDGLDDSGVRTGAGVYFVRVRVDGQTLRAVKLTVLP